MRKLIAAVSILALLAPAAAAHDGVNTAQARRITFPKLADGRSVLAVDLHTHSVFSDGNVWPTIRVEEAKRDGLYAMAVTEHLEYQPHGKDIPHPDRNRSFQIATDAATVKPDAQGVDKQPLMVINGSEITKAVNPPGHMNAVFITDANAINAASKDVAQQMKIANSQGAFVFWNHPYWTAQSPTGVATLDSMHAGLVKQGLLHGIEVANGADMSDEALKIALDNNLTILGTSDIHGLIDWDYDLENGAHRTATLVLTKSETPDGLKAALKAGDTVAIWKDNLIGKKDNVEAVVRSTLRLEMDAPLPRTTVTPVSIVNDSPVDYTLENTGGEGFYDAPHLITVKAGSKFTMLVKNVADPSKLTLTFKALNTYTAPREHLSVTMKPVMKAQ